MKNEGGKFIDVTKDALEDLMNLGIVKDAIWVDVNMDEKPDLVTVGEWSAVRIFTNQGATFTDESEKFGTSDLKGWWYSVEAADLDKDGDQDLIVGNIGLNTKFVANKKKPFQVFADDFDGNGSTDVVLTKEYKGKLVPTRGRQCSSEQMPFIAEKFPTYNGFAHAGVEDILGDDKMKSALKLEANEFHSLVLMNENGKFVVKYLPNRAQVSPINGIVTEDMDKDGIIDLLVAGNNYDTEVETPRYDAGQGLLLKGKGDGTFEVITETETGFLAPGNVKDLKVLHAKGEKSFIVVSRNNDKIQLFKL